MLANGKMIYFTEKAATYLLPEKDTKDNSAKEKKKARAHIFI